MPIIIEKTASQTRLVITPSTPVYVPPENRSKIYPPVVNNWQNNSPAISNTSPQVTAGNISNPPGVYNPPKTYPSPNNITPLAQPPTTSPGTFSPTNTTPQVSGGTNTTVYTPPRSPHVSTYAVIPNNTTNTPAYVPPQNVQTPTYTPPSRSPGDVVGYIVDIWQQ